MSYERLPAHVDSRTIYLCPVSCLINFFRLLKRYLACMLESLFENEAAEMSQDQLNPKSLIGIAKRPPFTTFSGE